MKTVSIDDLVRRIKEGTTREQLKEELNMNSVDFSAFKEHPKIKGLRSGISPSISFVDGPVIVEGEASHGTNPSFFTSSEKEDKNISPLV